MLQWMYRPRVPYVEKKLGAFIFLLIKPLMCMVIYNLVRITKLITSYEYQKVTWLVKVLKGNIFIMEE
jgi:hypothetical protein